MERTTRHVKALLPWGQQLVDRMGQVFQGSEIDTLAVRRECLQDFTRMTQDSPQTISRGGTIGPTNGRSHDFPRRSIRKLLGKSNTSALILAP